MLYIGVIRQHGDAKPLLDERRQMLCVIGGDIDLPFGGFGVVPQKVNSALFY